MRQVLHIIWNNESITLFLQTFLKNKSYLVLPLNNLICNLIIFCFTLKNTSFAMSGWVSYTENNERARILPESNHEASPFSNT